MNNPVVFSDFHHQSLLNSLVMLFEGRLGGTLMRPIGMEWYEEGYWDVYPHPDTAAQFLMPGSIPKDGTSPLNDELSHVITFEDFKKTKFDILIASLPQHIEPFKKLIREYQPQAKLIFQIGNAWNIPNNSISNVMASAKCSPPSQINYIEYHQEFDLNIFKYSPPPGKKKIYSFINCLNTVDIYKKDWELFLKLEGLMPDWEFKSFGGQCRDGWFGTPEEVAAKMAEADLIFMCKTEGDGYGHNIFSAAAMGKPLITRFSDYRGKLADSLLNTRCCISVDNNQSDIIADVIRTYNLEEAGEEIYQNFKENVDFDREELEIRKFLDRLL